MKAIIIFVCFLLGIVLSEKSEDKIPVQLFVFRSNSNETFYEDSIYKLDVAKNFNWIITNSTPACTTSLYKCACDELETVAGKAKHREMIIFVVEDLDVDSICTYTAHTNSPILLQIFHLQEYDHAIISLNSPAGRLHYEVQQQ
uniref:Uncharacterized protein n=1 Tax=Panagrolaimus sp. PS1159 TaxID=55785 RepID=A0AC35GK34_9BILA